MVDLPKVPRRFITIGEAPTTRYMAEAPNAAAPYKLLSDSLSKAGDAIEQVAIVAAERAGHEAVQKADDGSLVVERGPLPIIGNAGVAFSRAARMTYLGKAEPEIENKATEIRLQYQNDPDGFQKAWKAYSDQYLDNPESPLDPLVKPAIERVLSREGGQNYRTALTNADRLNVTNALETYKSRLSDLDNKGAALARQGGTDTPEYLEIQTSARQLYDELAKDPRFKYPKERIDTELASMASKHKGEAVIGTAMTLYDKATPTSAAEARKYLQTAAWDPKLNLSPAERHQIVVRGMAALDGRTGENKASVDANKKITSEWVEGLKTGAPYDERAFNDHLDRTVALGDVESYYKLVNYRALHDWRDSVTKLPLPQQIEALRALGGSSFVDRVVAAESGGNVNAQASTSSALGPGQFVKGTWLTLVNRYRPDLAQGKSEAEILDLRRNSGLAREMIARYGDENRKTLSDAGVRTDSAALYLSHFLGPSDAIKVLSAPPGTPLQGVVTPASISANQGIFERNPTAGDLANWAARKVGMSASAPATLWNEAARKEAENDFRKYLGGKIEQSVNLAVTALGKGRRLSDDEISTIAQGIRITGRADLLPKIETAAEAFDVAQNLEGQPTGVRQSLRARLQAQANDKADPTQRAVIDAAEESVKKTEAAMKITPYATGAARGLHVPPAAFNFENPQEFSAAVVQRGNMDRVHRSIDGTGAQSVFEGSENEAFRGALVRGNAEQVAGMFSGLARLDDDQLVATLDDAKVKDGIRGALRTTDPAKYTAIMSSLDSLYARAPATFAHLFGDDTWHQLKSWQSTIRYYDPQKIADERARVDDPQVAARRKANVEEGAKLARKVSADDIAGKLDTSWWPGPLARTGVIGAQGLPPVDGQTRDALMGDYETIFARRYSETLDKAQAEKETVELLKTKWARSEINGGKLMLRAPETVYPAVNGSYGWMKTQIEADLASRLGSRTLPIGQAMMATAEGGILDRGVPNAWDYTIVSDRGTEADVQAGRPASYQVLVKDNRLASPRWDLLRGDDGRPLRYKFDAGPDGLRARQNFEIERTRVLNQQKFESIDTARLPFGVM